MRTANPAVLNLRSSLCDCAAAECAALQLAVSDARQQQVPPTGTFHCSHSRLQLLIATAAANLRGGALSDGFLYYCHALDAEATAIHDAHAAVVVEEKLRWTPWEPPCDKKAIEEAQPLKNPRKLPRRQSTTLPHQQLNFTLGCVPFFQV